MGTQIAEPTMAKRNDVTVKVDAGVIRDAKIVAAYQDKSLAELLSEILRPAVAKMLEEEQARHAKRATKDKGSK